MTTATRPYNKGTRSPLAPHGTTARAKGRPRQGISGCGCSRCMAALRRYDKWRRLRNAEGNTLTVPAAPVAEHLQALLDAGASWAQLQTATGCSSSTLADLIHGRLAAVRRGTADRITAIQPGDCISERHYINITGAARRLRALQAIGHTCRAIAAVSGVDLSGVQIILNADRDRITRSVANRIDAAYRQLSVRPGNNQRAINRARREGWLDPAFWEDYGGIDDPDAPETEPAVKLGPRAEARLRAEEIRHLASFGISHAEIARRVGRTTQYVRDTLSGHGVGRHQRKQEEEA